MKKLQIFMLLLSLLLAACSPLCDGDAITPNPDVKVPCIKNESSPPPDSENLTTVEITAESFGDYFEFTLISNPVDVFGKPISTEDYDYYLITSKVYDDGLIFYDSVGDIEIICGSTTVKTGELYIRLSCPKGSVPTISTANATCVFAPNSYVAEYTLQDGYRCATFADGYVAESESRDIYQSYPY